jgi:hypothetical protein
MVGHFVDGRRCHSDLTNLVQNLVIYLLKKVYANAQCFNRPVQKPVRLPYPLVIYFSNRSNSALLMQYNKPLIGIDAILNNYNLYMCL